MRKTIVKIILVAALVLVTVLSLASCDMLPESITNLIGGKGECTHSEVVWVVDIPADCKLEGTKHSECAKCGAVFESNVVIEKSTEHTPGDWEVKISATCNRFGTNVKKCTVCKREVESAQVPKLTTHKYNYGVCTVCRAVQPESSGLEFVSNGDGTCTVKGMGSCTDTSLIIPVASPAGETVTAIGAAAFKDKPITSLIVPASVKSVSSDAFMGCKIELATVPAHAVSTVRGSYIRELTVIGDGKIDAQAMMGAKSLRVLKMEEGITEIGENAFDGCALASIIMPSSIKSIRDSAFANNSSLNILNIGSGVVEIGKSAFYNCDFLYTVNIPASVLRIGENAFYRSPRISAANFEVTAGWSNSSGTLSEAIMANAAKAADELMTGHAISRK